MTDVKVNQVWVAPMMGNRVLREVRILAPHPDGGYIIGILYSISLKHGEKSIERITELALEKSYSLKIDVCTHRNIDDAYIDSGDYAPPVPNYYRCTDCGDLFPNIGDTDLWFPKPLEVTNAQ